MKKILAAIITIAIACCPTTGFGQAGQPGQSTVKTTAQERQVNNIDDSFCKNDPRREIRVFCTDLFTFQLDVNAGIVSTLVLSKQDLDQLDLSNSHAADKFTKAMAETLAFAAALQTAEQSRLDKQLGASGNASGTTSLISKAGSAELLSLALDTGALTQSVNGTTSTLSTNADQVFRLVTGDNPDCILTFISNSCNSLGRFEQYVLNPTSFSATFALAQQSSTTTATSGQASGATPTMANSAAIPTGAGRLSSISMRYEVLNKFDPRSPGFQQKLKAEVKKADTPLNDAAKKADAAMQTVVDKLVTAATPLDDEARGKLLQLAQGDHTGKALVKAFEAYFSSGPAAVVKDPKFAADVAQVTQARELYQQVWDQVVRQAVGALFTMNYSYNQPLNQPKTHDVTLILAYAFQDKGTLTFNGAISIYGGALPADAKYGRIHDGQVSGEYDRTLSGKGSSIQTQLTLAGYWQYQPSPSVLNIPAGTVAPGTTIPIPNGTQEFVGTAGSLWVAQAKFTIKASKGINIPLGVSWSNKTDLLQGSRVGAQIGISYDFSTLAGLFTGGGGQ